MKVICVSKKKEWGFILVKEPVIINVKDIKPTPHPAGIEFSTIRGVRGDYTGLSLVTVEPGKGLAAHSHENSEEIMYIVKGSGKYTWENMDGKWMEKDIKEGDFVIQTRGLKQETLNTGKEPLVLIASVVPSTGVRREWGPAWNREKDGDDWRKERRR